MLYLSQFLSTDAQKKGAQIALHRLLPLSMSKKSRQKTKTPPKKNRFLADFCLGSEKRCGRVVDIEFLSEIERKHAQWTPHAMVP